MSNCWHDLPQPFFILAPMEAVTDVVFRHVVRRAGAPDMFFTEFANATGWVHAGQKAIAGRLLKTEDEHPLVAQIWGGEPGDMEQFARHCRELGFDGIDINMGCPAKSAIKSGGAALIRKPEVAVAAIQAAKTAGLPVSVKTRLGYSSVDEWRDWLRTILEQDVVNLTIHLRTKKEMSKVPAHVELIDEIVALRDEVAPQTLLTINGDIASRAHGLELAAQHPGVNGIMIGRGVFADPFCFADDSATEEPAAPPLSPRAAKQSIGTAESTSSLEGFAFPAKRGQERQLDQLAAERPERMDGASGDSEERNDKEARSCERLFDLLRYHLDLFDHHQPHTSRPFETLKRFFKIYIKGFDGAKELRDQLMHTKNTDEVRAALNQFQQRP